MRSLCYPLCGILFLGLTLRAGGADPKPAETPYYPLPVGTVWQYRVVDVGRGSVARFSLKVAALEKVGDVLCTRIEKTADGRVDAFEHLAVAADGVYRYDVGGIKLDKPIRILALPPKSGFTWTVEARGPNEVLKGTFTLGAEKATKVPAGTYDTVTVTSDDLDSNGLKLTSVSQYAQGVGLVKQRLQVAGQTSVIELEKFEPAKKP